MSQESLSTKRQLKPSWLAECVVCNHLEQTTIRLIIVGRFWPVAARRGWLQSADSVEKVGSAAAGLSGVPAVEVAGNHFKLPFGVSLSFLAQV